MNYRSTLAPDPHLQSFPGAPGILPTGVVDANPGTPGVLLTGVVDSQLNNTTIFISLPATALTPLMKTAAVMKEGVFMSDQFHGPQEQGSFHELIIDLESLPPTDSAKWIKNDH